MGKNLNLYLHQMMIDNLNKYGYYRHIAIVDFTYKFINVGIDIQQHDFYTLAEKYKKRIYSHLVKIVGG